MWCVVFVWCLCGVCVRFFSEVEGLPDTVSVAVRVLIVPPCVKSHS